MTQDEFNIFLLSSAILCFVLAAVNLLRRKSRGSGAHWLSAACAVLGGAILAVRQNLPMPMIVALGVVVFVLLVIDFAVRARDRHPGSKS
ncbi:MAG: hypothetical protein BGO01_15780 [Armatimonadetes bacterium 55-13]|nr:MAG: hypothetical protein BGO01_15780 [Armatimonadetes bacterium 55-13]